MSTVLITGASTGIGLALSRLLLDSDYHLILTARAGSLARFNQAGIEERERVWIRALDVTRDDERRAVVSEATRRRGGIDVLVNNAGVSFRSVVEQVNDRERLSQMNVNFHSPMELIRLVLPHMRRQREGRIINVSSVGGMMAMPTMAIYSASKFALEGATEALWYEVRPWNIKVSLVQPGFVRSESFRNTRHTFQSKHAVEDDHDPYHDHYVNMAGFIARCMGRSPATPESIARTIVRIMKHPSPPLRVPGAPDSRLFGWMRRFLPRRLYHHILYLGLPNVRSWGKTPPPAGAQAKNATLNNPATGKEIAQFPLAGNVSSEGKKHFPK